ncbi:MAG: class I tRNA ligase family protein [Candidatus Pacebacteria bacterium]|nr:class I tRNA ligase family protein [Candidatus Paceibacterota bacterium]
MAEDKGRGTSDTAQKEEEVLAFWNKEQIFEQSLKKPAPQGEFVFYDGPPFATGLPHSGSLLSSVSKDVIPRYKTMRGYFVRRRWGWDTHGLPIENLVEKKLGLKNKKDILALGIEKFNEEARSMVLEYVADWKRYIERVGRWVDFDNSYKTMDASYTESVWWALKEIHKKGNLYEGRKVLMYCPHCETVLAKAEIAMDNTYKDVTEEAVFVKFRILNPEKLGLSRPTFMMAWTTTPWTLPGNVALAVGPDIDYVYVEVGDEVVIVAKERAAALGLTSTMKEPVKGAELVGLAYEPLYALDKVQVHTGKKWQVLSADFVTTEDGTGVVHTAVIYGEDDYQLGLKEGLPMVPILNANATYNDDAPEFVRGQYIKKAEALIKSDLETRGLLFKKEAHTHSYPHCYRCGTPLIYNAVSSWFINIQSVKEKLLSENEKVTWVPEHLKHGRFGKIVEGAPDWTISRNRFWASPLPIWKDADGNVTVVGSLEELKTLTKKSGNTYFVMRHGESENNTTFTLNGDPNNIFHLTEKGVAQVRASAESLKGRGITRIVASNMTRAKESADIVAKELGLPADAVIVDARFKEVSFGAHEGQHLTQLTNEVPTNRAWLSARPGGGESLVEIRRRVAEALYELDGAYTNETVLIVSHDKPLRMLFDAVHPTGADYFNGVSMAGDFFLANAEVKELPFVPLPHNKDYELDYHLPYIDRIELVKDGKPLTRIPEVVDCWVESGSMPFAEYHYPFENKAEFEKRTPGDFISEYIGQTRAWFYYMHAMSVHVFGHQAFKNVVTTGNVNASDGQKLSKSKKNYTDPYLLFDQYGADAFRYYLMSSVVMQAEDMQFRDDEVKDVHARVINLLRNVKSFYELFKDEAPTASAASVHPLDVWILTRLSELTTQTTAAFDAFDTVRATRPMRDFIDDLSTWYVRRSRDRVKGEDKADAGRALATLRYVLLTLSKVIAPVMPFIADEVYRTVRTDADPVSVHLTEWSAPLVISDNEIVKDMELVRFFASHALDARQRAGVKVRQPLATLKIRNESLATKPDLLEILKSEINVKKVICAVTIADHVELDATLTDELKEEGELRDLIREVQDMRKTAGLNPKDQAVLAVPAERLAFVEKHWGALSRATGLVRVQEGQLNVTKA